MLLLSAGGLQAFILVPPLLVVPLKAEILRLSNKARMLVMLNATMYRNDVFAYIFKCWY
jgi:hypothetical protein